MSLLPELTGRREGQGLPPVQEIRISGAVPGYRSTLPRRDTNRRRPHGMGWCCS